MEPKNLIVFCCQCTKRFKESDVNKLNLVSNSIDKPPPKNLYICNSCFQSLPETDGTKKMDVSYNMMDSEMPISTYFEYIEEAISVLYISLQYQEKTKNIPIDIGSDNSALYSEQNGRYAFLMIANSLEAAANALLLSLSLDRSLYEQYERMDTLTKFRTFCAIQGKNLEIGDARWIGIKEIIECRNAFVHPKPKNVNILFNIQEPSIEYKVKTTKTKFYPHYFGAINSSNAINALKDVLDFLSWVCFDVCELNLKEGALKLGLGAYGFTGDLYNVQEMTSIKLDLRSFGIGE